MRVIPVYYLNLTANGLVFFINYEIYQIGRCIGQIVDFTTESLVHQICRGIYWLAVTYFRRPVYYTTI